MKPVFQFISLGMLPVLLCSSVLGDDVKITPDVVYGHKVGLALTFDVFQPEKNANGAGVLFMVSGGWYSRWSPPANMTARFKPLLDRGFTVFSVRHGSSPKFNIPEVIADVRRSVRFVRLNAKKFGVEPDRLGVYGGSAGGHLSLMLGTTSDEGNPKAIDKVLRVSNRVAAVVAYFPPTDVRPWVKKDSSYNKNFPALRFDPAKGGDYSPLLHVSADDPPTLLVHGDKDTLVPISHSNQIYKAFQDSKVESKLVVIKGAAHGFRRENSKRANQALVDWFVKHLTEETSDDSK